MIHVIICGGSGKRLWPLIKKEKPKQFATIISDTSLYTQTLKRNESLSTSTYIVTNKNYYNLAKEQSEGIKNKNYILEASGRNTAAAIAFAAFDVSEEKIILVTPSDHIIHNQAEYNKSIKQAEFLANQDKLVILGVKPQKPETGFGYIEQEKGEVVSFDEKPDLQTAVKYFNSDNHFCSTGIFCFKAGVFLQELKQCAPEIYQTSLAAYKNRSVIDNKIDIKADDMSNIPSVSVDNAVLEHSKRLKMVECNFRWSDIGNFVSLKEELNSYNYNPNHIAINSKNNIIYSDEKTVATIGIDDLIIVDTQDTLLICKKDQSQSIKDMVNKISNIKTNAA